jgi:hypothetical protein
LDPNTRPGIGNGNVLKDMLNEGREIEYLGDSSIRFSCESIIIVEKV